MHLFLVLFDLSFLYKYDPYTFILVSDYLMTTKLFYTFFS